MDRLHITSYLYIFLGIDLCHRAQRNYLEDSAYPEEPGFPKEPVKTKNQCKVDTELLFQSLTN